MNTKRLNPFWQRLLPSGWLTTGTLFIAAALVQAQAQPYQNGPVGAPALAGSTTVSATNIVIVGGGNDIWNNSDNFHYYWTAKTGGFDAIVRVTDLQGPDAWTKAELMARFCNDDGAGTLVPAGGDPFFATMTTRSAGQNEINIQYRDARDGGCNWPGSPTSPIRPVYPNVWLRLQRLGNIFISYSSTDGTNWTELSRKDQDALATPFPATIAVGLAVTAHNDTDANGARASFDNLQFKQPPPEIVRILPRNKSSYNPANSQFTFAVTSGVGVNTTNITLKVNGQDVSSALTFTGTVADRTVVYNGPFTVNTFYVFDMSATDTSGSKNSLRITWDTITDANFTIEGEDFNFDGGQYIDNVVLGSAPAANNYLDRVGQQNIDRFRAANGGNHQYRMLDASVDPPVGEWVGTEVTGDIARAKFITAQVADPGVQDYNVGWFDVGEWLDYTRTVPKGAYQIFARLASGNAASSQYIARFDKVSNAAVQNQVLAPLGTFTGYGSGQWQNYEFVPLKDAFGNSTVYTLDGKTSLRLTLLTGGINANFLTFVPVSNPGILAPVVSSISPVPNATGVNPDVSIDVYIINRDGKVKTDSVKLNVNGTDVAPVVTATDAGASVSYLPADFWAATSTNKVTLVYADDATNSVTNSWQFIVRGAMTTMPLSYAMPSGSGNTPGMSVRLSQNNGSGQANTTVWMESQLNSANVIIAQGFDVTDVFNYWGNSGVGNFGNDKVIVDTFGLAGGDNFAMEAITYLELKRGVYTMGVNSDDGFRLTAGAEAHTIGTVLGEYNGGRGVADTTFDILVQTNGLYPFRLAYEQGGGGNACEWFSVYNGTRILINDTTNPNAIKGYRFATSLPANPLTISQQPTNITAIENTPVTIAVNVTSTLVTNANQQVTYQWQKDGADITEPWGMRRTISLPLVKKDNAGVYTCTITILGFKTGTVTSQAATLTVNDDTVAPTITRVQGSGDRKAIVITFSEPLDQATAETIGNYKVDGGVTVTSATLSPNGMTVTLRTSAQTAGTKYNITFNGINDTAAVPNTIAANTKLAFTGFISDWGVANIDYFDGLSGGTVDLLLNAQKYIDNMPDRYTVNTAFETAAWSSTDNYGGRITALINPPETGNYTFYISSDDSSRLYISTDDKPANLGTTPIARVDGWTAQRNWTTVNAPATAPDDGGTSKQKSDLISLVAGKQYYLMALWKEGGGGDGCSVGWTLPSQQTAGTITVIGGRYVTGNVNPDGSYINVTQQPVDVSTFVNRQAAFRVVANAGSSLVASNAPIVYQWQKNGQDIVGAASAFYTTPVLGIGDNGAKYQCLLHVAALTVTSVVATLTVQADAAPPVALSAGSLVNSNMVGILFDEPLEAASAGTAANYTVAGATVTSAQYRGLSGKVVVLTLDKAATEGMTITIKGVKDLAGNAIGTASVVNKALSYITTDVGSTNTGGVFTDPLFAGSVYPVGADSFEMVAGGSDIWNAADGMYFLGNTVKGDFDAVVRVENITRPDQWAKAGIMAREDLGAGSRNNAIFSTPTNGVNVITVQWRDTVSTTPASLASALRPTPVPYPDTWLRLVRQTNSFISYWSMDGQQWTALWTNTPAAALSETLYVGLATTAHINNTTTNAVALFRSYKLSGGSTPTPVTPTISSARNAGNLVLTFTGVLQSAPSVAGPWTDVNTASPATIQPGTAAGKTFYRARSN